MLETRLTEVFRAKTLNASANTPFSSEFKMGEAWTALRLFVNIALTVGSGSGAISEGELQLINSVNFKTDKGETIYKTCPARWIFRLDQIQSKTLPNKDAIAAATATYRVPLTLWFIDPRLNDDDAYRSILDTSRYKSVELLLGIGSVANLLSVTTGASIAVTLDAYIESLAGDLRSSGAPAPDLYRRIGVAPPQQTANQVYIDLDKAPDLFYKRWGAFSGSGATSGSPMTGTAADTIVSDLNLEVTNAYIQFSILNYALQRKNKTDYEMETQLAGWHFISVVDGSRTLKTVFAAANQSMLRLNYTAAGSYPSDSQVTVGYDAVSKIAAY